MRRAILPALSCAAVSSSPRAGYVPSMAGATTPFTALDATRQMQGRLLDAFGFGPVQTPSRTVFSTRGARVRAYAGADRAAPPVLLVPAPIKRAYIWDLEPSRSIVRLLAGSGFQVHLLEWLEPGPGDEDLGLSDFIGDILFSAVDAVQSRAGAVPVLIGHSLGGTMAAMFSALYPDLTCGVALLEAPLHFGGDAGAFAPWVAATPDAAPVRAVFGNVPGSFLSVASATAAPVTFQLERHLDLLTHVLTPSLRTHLRVERWTLDEMAFPGRLFEEVVEQLYRKDRFMTGELVLRKRRIGPDRVVRPLLTVVDPSSRIVPPESIVPFHDAAASTSKKLLRYEGEGGVALRHVGVLVGTNAHTQVWPEVVGWARELAG